jgi:hypothetical protein
MCFRIPILARHINVPTHTIQKKQGLSLLHKAIFLWKTMKFGASHNDESLSSNWILIFIGLFKKRVCFNINSSL